MGQKVSYPDREEKRVSRETIYRVLFIQPRGVLDQAVGPWPSRGTLTVASIAAVARLAVMMSAVLAVLVQ